MKVFVLHANPVENSFGAALHGAAIDALCRAGHDVDDCDLYAESFDPVLSREDRLVYDDPVLNRRSVECYVNRLLAADGLVAVFPVWNLGFPAILKGFFDRVFLPGVTFEVRRNGSIQPKLHNIRRLGAICTYGGSRFASLILGDAPRHYMKRSVKAVCKPGVSCEYLALYGMNTSKPTVRSKFLAHIGRRFSSW